MRQQGENARVHVSLLRRVVPQERVERRPLVDRKRRAVERVGNDQRRAGDQAGQVQGTDGVVGFPAGIVFRPGRDDDRFETGCSEDVLLKRVEVGQFAEPVEEDVRLVGRGVFGEGSPLVTGQQEGRVDDHRGPGSGQGLDDVGSLGLADGDGVKPFQKSCRLAPVAGGNFGNREARRVGDARSPLRREIKVVDRIAPAERQRVPDLVAPAQVDIVIGRVLVVLGVEAVRIVVEDQVILFKAPERFGAFRLAFLEVPGDRRFAAESAAEFAEGAVKKFPPQNQPGQRRFARRARPGSDDRAVPFEGLANEMLRGERLKRRAEVAGVEGEKADPRSVHSVSGAPDMSSA